MYETVLKNAQIRTNHYIYIYILSIVLAKIIEKSCNFFVSERKRRNRFKFHQKFSFPSGNTRNQKRYVEIE